MKFIKTFESLTSQKYLEELLDDIIKLMVKRTVLYDIQEKDGLKYLNYINGAYLPNLDISNYDEELQRFIKETKIVVVPEKNHDSLGSYTLRKDMKMIYLKFTDEFIEDINGELEKSDLEQALYFKFNIHFDSSLLHELQHAWDDWKSDGKSFHNKKWGKFVDKKKKLIKSDSFTKEESDAHKMYMNLQHEINARFAQTIKKIYFTDIDDDTKTVETMKPLEKVLKDFKVNFEGYGILSPKDKKRLINRVIIYWGKYKDELDELEKKKKEKLYR